MRVLNVGISTLSDHVAAYTAGVHVPIMVYPHDHTTGSFVRALEWSLG